MAEGAPDMVIRVSTHHNAYLRMTRCQIGRPAEESIDNLKFAVEFIRDKKTPDFVPATPLFFSLHCDQSCSSIKAPPISTLSGA